MREPASYAAHIAADGLLRQWQKAFDEPLRALRRRISEIVPGIDGSVSDLQEYQRLALASLLEREKQAGDRSARAIQDTKRKVEIENQIDVARNNLQTIDDEIARIAVNSRALGAILAEVTSFIYSEVCPVCDRDFSEVDRGPLSEHVNQKIWALSGSAERLLGLTRT